MKRTVSRVKGTMILSRILADLLHLHLIHMPSAVGRIKLIREKISCLNGIWRLSELMEGPADNNYQKLMK